VLITVLTTVLIAATTAAIIRLPIVDTKKIPFTSFLSHHIISLGSSLWSQFN
jgi:hypothetical protein